MLRATRTEICLPNLSHNIAVIRSSLRPETKFLAVVKANAYGHGLEEVARYVAAHGADYLGVAIAEEGVRLREAGIDAPILILGASMDTHIDCILDYGLTPTVFSIHTLQSLQEAAAARQKTCRFHFKVDTGMNRIGMACTEAAADMAARISRMPGIRTEGLFTPLARADETDKEPTRRQLEAYRRFASWLEQRGVAVSVRHVSNSAGIIDQEGTGWDMVRAGISLYGLYPSHEVQRNRIPLQPVMELKSHISYVKEIPAGAQVSYGGTFTADHPMTVATIPVGYGDGYPRYLSGKGWVLIGGKKAPILGRVCMDQMMADVSSVPQACRGEEVTLLGRDGDACISAEELAGAGGGFHYELLCGISKRVPRVYVKDGKTVTISDISGC